MYIYASQDSLPESIFFIHCGKMQIMEMPAVETAFETTVRGLRELERL